MARVFPAWRGDYWFNRGSPMGALESFASCERLSIFFSGPQNIAALANGVPGLGLAGLGNPRRASMGRLNPLEHPSMEKFADRFAMDEVHREAHLDGADFVQSRDVPGVEVPVEAFHVVVELREFSSADNRNDIAIGAQPV